MIEKININKVKPNTDNPRVIKDYKFNKLVNSIKEFPQMLELRPIVVNKNNVILGGNMRYRACQEAGLKEIHIFKTDMSKKKQQEFIIKDNVNFGEWDWDILANDWKTQELVEWGMDLWQNDDDLEEFFNEDIEDNKTQNNTIVFKFDNETTTKVLNKLIEINKDKEVALCKVLDIKN